MTSHHKGGVPDYRNDEQEGGKLVRQKIMNSSVNVRLRNVSVAGAIGICAGEDHLLLNTNNYNTLFIRTF